MKKILNIITSPMGAASNSIRLQKEVIAKLQEQYPGSTVTERNLAEQRYPHLEEAHLSAFFAPSPADSNEYKDAVKHSDEAIAELLAADIIVIGTPMYNFSVPSALKAWIDHIVRAGKTFRYNESGMPEGMVHGKKLYLAIASGSIYTEGPYKAYDFVDPYLRAIFGFLGIVDVATYRAEGVNIPGVQETALQKGLESVAV